MAPGPATRTRRTQEERSALTRAKLLDATVECLVEFGYASTTTQRVAAKAGVTRGAQVHHFPSKADLVIAAVHHLAVKRSEQAVSEFARILGRADAGDKQALLREGLDLMWQTHQGATFIATVELWVAARTDPELAQQMRGVEPVVTETVSLLNRSTFDADPKEMRDFVLTAMDAIRGILLSGFADADDERHQRQWRRVREQLLRLAAVSFPSALQ